MRKKFDKIVTIIAFILSLAAMLSAGIGAWIESWSGNFIKCLIYLGIMSAWAFISVLQVPEVFPNKRI